MSSIYLSSFQGKDGQRLEGLAMKFQEPRVQSCTRGSNPSRGSFLGRSPRYYIGGSRRGPV